jgi:uncharacterized protein (TIGR03089 family)
VIDVAEPATPPALLSRALRADPARPFLTYYDVSSGGRVELSVATFDNWVSKTAGLVRDELDVEPGDAVSVVLPAHWLALVWAQAVWTVGARLLLTTDAAQVAVRAADDAQAGSTTAGQLVVVSTAALGGPAGARTPTGALDFGRLVLGFPDVAGPPAASEDPLLDDLLAQARGSAAQAPRRGLVVGRSLTTAVVRDALLLPLLVDGSCVLVSGAPTAEQVASIGEQEGAVTTGRR